MDQRIKVAHITTVDLSLRFLLLHQLRDLVANGFEVVGISTGGEYVPDLQAIGVRHIAVPMQRRAFTPLADLCALWQLLCVMRREQFTLVHTHTPKAGLLGRWAAKLAGVPVIVHTNHGFVFHERSSRFWRSFFIALERMAARCCDLILSVNQEDIDTALREGICDSSKIIRLGRGGIGIDITRFDRARFTSEDLARKRRAVGLPDNAPVVGFVGRLVKEKGLLELLAAMRKVRQRVANVQLLVIGPIDSEKPDALTPAVAADYGIADICHFVGLRQDLDELYPLMDAFVLPSHREGLPVSPMEASAMQVPCVVTDIRGCRDVVEDKRNGIVTSLGDVSGLADAITELLTHPRHSREMGKQGRLIALEKFDERQVFELVTSEYTRLLQAKGLMQSVQVSRGAH